MRVKFKNRALALAAIATLGARSTAKADTVISSFTPGDLVIMRGGDATNPNTGSTVTLGAYLDEYTPNGTYAGTIVIPQTANASNNALTLSNGGGSHEGILTLSANGNWLAFGGYNTPPTTNASGAGISTDTLGEISQSASTLNTSTVIGAATIRGATTIDGNEFFVSNSPGVRYINGIGSSATNTQISSSYDTRSLATVNSTLIAGSGSSSLGVHGAWQLGNTGTLPTSSIPGTTSLTGASAQSATDFIFADEPDDALTSSLYQGMYNVLYSAGGSGSAPTVNKYEYNGTTFTLLNSIAAPSVNGNSDILVGITDIVSGSNVDVYFTDATGVHEIVDSDNANSQLPNIGSVIASATPGESFYGIALAPTTASTAKNLTWNNTGGTGDGVTWNTTGQNWNNGSGVTTFSSTPGDNVIFDDSSGLNHYAVKIPTGVTAGTITVNTAQTGGYTFSGAGSIGGGKGLTLTNGTLTLANTGGNSYGNTFVNGGTLNVEAPGAVPAGSGLFVAAGASVVVNRNGGGRIGLNLNSLSNNGLIDLQNNDLIIHNVDAFTANVTLAGIFTQLQTGYAGGTWGGSSGIISSNSANSPLHTLGEATGTTGVDNSSVPTDVVVKYTYYGDANLDGRVDGSDYSRIDNGYLSNLTGWSNGDFNYDGVVNGSDYTLIDNAFNTQGTSMANELASQDAASTAELAPPGNTASVPEPASLGLLAGIGLGLLVRRHRKSHFMDK